MSTHRISRIITIKLKQQYLINLIFYAVHFVHAMWGDVNLWKSSVSLIRDEKFFLHCRQTKAKLWYNFTRFLKLPLSHLWIYFMPLHKLWNLFDWGFCVWVGWLGWHKNVRDYWRDYRIIECCRGIMNLSFNVKFGLIRLLVKLVLYF